jgi:hypothetical protein
MVSASTPSDHLPSADQAREILARALDLPLEQVATAPIPGRVHDHWPLVDSPTGENRLVRVARMSHLGLPPTENLAYAEAAFRRAGPSGAVPRLHRVLPVSDALPWGALLVERVEGRTPEMTNGLTGDLPAIARALAAIHAIPAPEGEARAPILDPVDPVGYLLEVAERQLAGLWDDIPADAAAIMRDETAWARGFAEEMRAAGRVPPKVLAFADTHPGNFRIRRDGSAVLLDVERPVYDCPGLDLAHASLPTSLIWDPEVRGGEDVTDSDVRAFHAIWAEALGSLGRGDLAAATEPWITPYRRLVWLRTTSWACAWAARNDLADALRSPDAAKSALARRLARFVDPEMMERARAWWR